MPSFELPSLARVDLSIEPPGYFEALFLATAQERGYRNRRSEQRAIGEVDFAAEPAFHRDAAYLSRGLAVQRILVEGENALASVRVRPRSAEVAAAGDAAETVDELIDLVYSRLPEPESHEVTTPVTFWSELRGFGHLEHRRIDALPWSQIDGSYGGATATGLTRLMGISAPPTGGRLILWHGEPGTGKTHALRALGHEWHEWCSVECITDPDRLIEGGMGYLTQVLNADELEAPQARKHKLLVLEDAGELLAADARKQSGQGLSRLLNLSDGLLGVGMNAIVLITTNEPLGRLHPAVHRPGRCLSEVEFRALDVDEANIWLERHGCGELVSEPKTLAQLYAIRDGREQGARAVRVGFG